MENKANLEYFDDRISRKRLYVHLFVDLFFTAYLITVPVVNFIACHSEICIEGIEITAWWDPVKADAPSIRQALYVSASKVYGLIDKGEIVKKISAQESGSKWTVSHAMHEERVQKQMREAVGSLLLNRVRLNDHVPQSNASDEEQITTAMESISLACDEGKTLDYEIAKPDSLNSIADVLNKSKTRCA